MIELLERRAIVSEVLGTHIGESLKDEEYLYWQQSIMEYQSQIEKAKELVSLLPNFKELPLDIQTEFIINLVENLPETLGRAR